MPDKRKGSLNAFSYLFTCWPPGPEDRLYDVLKMLSGKVEISKSSNHSRTAHLSSANESSGSVERTVEIVLCLIAKEGLTEQRYLRIIFDSSC